MSDILNEKRGQIDEIDRGLTALFTKRMQCVREIAKYKAEHKLPVLSSGREREVIANLTKDVDDEMAEYIKMLYTTLFDLSRAYQEQSIVGESEVEKRVEAALNATEELFPKYAVVACQGIEGANSSLACDKLFSRANIIYLNSFEGVFKAVDSGLCEYGILPIENSLHGSVTEVYDLMGTYDFHIVRSVRVKINHTLLAKRGVKIEDVREVYSHPQALAQCSDFFKKFPHIKACPYTNTGLAAEMVAQSDRADIGAIADKGCAELYALSMLSDDVQNSDNNHTRFICISKKAQIFPGADKVSLMFTVSHRPGSLYNIISKFFALGVNMSKLESRPIPGKDFEFMFYVDFEANVKDKAVKKLLSQLQSSCEKFSYLGSYHEI